MLYESVMDMLCEIPRSFSLLCLVPDKQKARVRCNGRAILVNVLSAFSGAMFKSSRVMRILGLALFFLVMNDHYELDKIKGYGDDTFLLICIYR